MIQLHGDIMIIATIGVAMGYMFSFFSGRSFVDNVYAGILTALLLLAFLGLGRLDKLDEDVEDGWVGSDVVGEDEPTSADFLGNFCTGCYEVCPKQP